MTNENPPPSPAKLFLVHFKSRDLTRIHRQGQFWHIFFTSGHVIISQDEVDTWTAHTPLPLDFDETTLNQEQAVHNVLGGSVGPYPIKIDEILVTSTWRPNIYLADKYISPKGRVFLSGDAAHQNIPTGGYGMNTAVGDSFDIGWKLAAVLSGYGGKTLLQSYEDERRPVAARNIERSGVHWSQHMFYKDLVEKKGVDVALSNTPEGDEIRKQIHDYILLNDGENKDLGIELGYRYNGSPVIFPDDDDQKEPTWTEKSYIASTWPGARAPHVFLKDQDDSSIFDLFGRGPEYSLVDFSPDARYITAFSPKCKESGIPVKMIHLPNEAHVRDVWERDAVLVRPDDHVAWRAPLQSTGPENIDVDKILAVVTGRVAATAAGGKESEEVKKVKQNGFTGTVGNVDHDNVEHLSAFQK